MSKVIDANDMRYTRRHEWVMLEDGIATVGITDHAQREISEINFVELPSDGTDLTTGEEAATLESASDSLSIVAPLDGVVVEINRLLEDAPELINSDPYGDGWLFRMEVSDISVWQDLLTAEEYEELIS